MVSCLEATIPRLLNTLFSCARMVLESCSFVPSVLHSDLCWCIGSHEGTKRRTCIVAKRRYVNCYAETTLTISASLNRVNLFLFLQGVSRQADRERNRSAADSQRSSLSDRFGSARLRKVRGQHSWTSYCN